VSQLLTLYITPVYYVYIENARLRVMRRRQAAAESTDAIVTESGAMPPLADAQPPLRRMSDGDL
jgi:hypothetical protein